MTSSTASARTHILSRHKMRSISGVCDNHLGRHWRSSAQVAVGLPWALAPTPSERRSGVACQTQLTRKTLSAGRPLAQRRVKSVVVPAAPSDVYVFGLEGVVCEPDGSQVYADAQQIKAFEAPFYIASGLSAEEVVERVKAIGLDIAPESPQLFTGLSATQTADVLKQISQRPVVRDGGARLNFLSSSAAALKAVKSSSGVPNLRLYLAGWSSEGRASKAEFEADGDVTVLDAKQFSELLSWGLLMGVDDGCGDDN